MITGETILNEASQWGIELQANGDKIRYRPRSAMTVELAERIRSHKAELLAILAASEGVDTVDTDNTPSVAPKNEGIVTMTSSNDPAYADREIKRFINVAVPWPDRRGSYDSLYTGIIEALALAEHDQPIPPALAGRQPDLYSRPDGGTETFVQRAERFRQDLNMGVKQ